MVCEIRKTGEYENISNCARENKNSQTREFVAFLPFHQPSQIVGKSEVTEKNHGNTSEIRQKSLPALPSKVVFELN